MRPLTADAVAALVGGTLVGDGATPVRAAAPLDRAGPDELSFLARAQYAPLFAASRAGTVLVAPDLAESAGSAAARIVVASPQEAMLRVLPSLYPERAPEPGIHPTAVIGRGVTLGRDVSIGPHVVVDDGAAIGDRVRLDAGAYVGRGVPVGDDSRLFHGVTLYEGAVVGKRVRLHAGVRIASDGFGYVFHEGAHRKIPHVGRAVVGDDVEIGANSTVDRGSIDDTVIGAGTKLDNQVMVAHNVRIGKLCLLMSQVGIAGSARIGDGAILAGQAGVGGHLTIGAGARIGGQAGVFGDVPAGETWSGYPARPHRESLRASAALLKLAGMMKGLERLLAREER
jgi:UDP-3-O-[3-hydroxymyristoyl] glucosamine N-acyltransferase